MNLRIKNLLIISMAMSLNGCGDSAPSCSDSDVKELVIEMSEEKILPQIVIEAADGKKISYKDCQIAIYGLSNGTMEELANKDTATEKTHKLWDNVKRIQKEIEKRLKGNIKITSIRTNSKNEVAKKTECSAEVEYLDIRSFEVENTDIRSYEVNYSAQYTEDDKVLVEVY